MKGGRFFNLLLLLLAIGCTLVVSTAAAAPSHWHSQEIGGGCQICTVAHLPALQPPVAIQIGPPARAVWHIPASVTCRIVEYCQRAVSPRGPPAESPLS